MKRWESRRLVSGVKSDLGVGLCELGRWERVGCIWLLYVNHLQYLDSERVMQISMPSSMQFGFTIRHGTKEPGKTSLLAN